jgi:hypothetical protein
MAHLSDDEIEHFLTARLHPGTQQEVIRHLLAGCGGCSRKIAERVPGPLLEEVEEGRRRKTDPATPRVRAVASALRRDTLWRADDRKLARSLELLGRPSCATTTSCSGARGSAGSGARRPSIGASSRSTVSRPRERAAGSPTRP